MGRLKLFGPAAQAAGRRSEEAAEADVGAVLSAASARYGRRFAEVLAGSQVWLNGRPASPEEPVGPDDEVAVLPPVSGGAGGNG